MEQYHLSRRDVDKTSRSFDQNDLWDHGVGMKVYALGRDKCEGGRRLFEDAGY